MNSRDPAGRIAREPAAAGIDVIGLRSPLPAASRLLTHQFGRPVVHGTRLRDILRTGGFDVIWYDRLSLVGGPGPFPTATRRRYAGMLERFFGRLPVDQISRYYDGALALIVPSICYGNLRHHPDRILPQRNPGDRTSHRPLSGDRGQRGGVVFPSEAERGRMEARAPAMKILITGGAGFIRSQLAERLLDDGHGVVALDNLSTGSPGNIAAIAKRPGFECVIGSVRDASLVDELVQTSDVTVDLAAAGGAVARVPQMCEIVNLVDK